MRKRPGDTKEPWLLIKAQDEDARAGKTRRTSSSESRARSSAAARSRRSPTARAKRECGTRTAASRRTCRPAPGRHRPRLDATPKHRAAGSARPANARARQTGKQVRPGHGGARSRGAARLRAALARDAAHARAERRRLGARDQVRRLSHPGAARRRKGAAASPARGSTGPSVSRASRRAVEALPADTALIDGEIVVEEGGVSELLRPAGGAQGRAQRASSSITRSISFISTAAISGHLPLVERKAELARTRRPRRPRDHQVQRAFPRKTARTCWRTCLRHGARGHRLEEASTRPIAAAASEAFVKIKCSNAQELVVGGYAPSNVTPNAIGALRGRLLRSGQAALCRARRHRLHAGGRARPVEAAASAGDREAAVRRHPARRAPRRALGQADDGDRGQSRRLDGGQHGAPGRVQGRARGQAGEGGRARGTGHGERGKPRQKAAQQRQGGGSLARNRPRGQRSRRTNPRLATCASPIRIASTGRMSASPSRTSPTTTAWRGSGWRRRS